MKTVSEGTPEFAQILTDVAVPVFDGRDKFQLGKYWDRPYTGKVTRGTTVMLVFSVKRGSLPKDVGDVEELPAAVKFAIYLNILGIIVLAEPADQFSNEASQEMPEAFGVDSIVQWPVVEASEDESESNGEEEQFL